MARRQEAAASSMASTSHSGYHGQLTLNGGSSRSLAAAHTPSASVDARDDGIECVLHNLAPIATREDVMQCIADALHSDRRYLGPDGQKINFEVKLYDSTVAWTAHTGKGVLTIPYKGPGLQFVRDFQRRPLRPLGFNDHRIMRVSVKDSVPREGLIDVLRRTPYRDLKAVAAEMRQWDKDAELLPVTWVQFGRACRDGVFSIERAVELHGKAKAPHSTREPEGWLSFNIEHSYIVVGSKSGTLKIYANRVNAVVADTKQKCVVLFLDTPPAYEKAGEPHSQHRHRLESFAEGLEAIVAYTSRTLRICFDGESFPERFDEIGRKIRLPDATFVRMKAETRNLYSVKLRRKVRDMQLALDLRIAIQLDALLTNGVLHPDELLRLNDAVKDAAGDLNGGVEHAAEAVRRFAEELRQIDLRSGRPYGADKDLVKLFRAVSAGTSETAARSPVFNHNARCMQATVTPTTIWLQGPFEDMSNRVLRRFKAHQHHFLRVSFADEDGLPYRYERGINWPEFLQARVGRLLRDGVRVANRNFEFLAFSMSSIRARTVWFVTPFEMDGKVVSAASIRDGLGDFTRVQNSPARYGARIAQAFTATSPSIKLAPEQIVRCDDIMRDGYCFTDGAARLSQELADEVWLSLHRGSYPSGPTPAAYQFRLGGFKGVATIDTRLTGSVIHIPPSCDKFDAEDSLELEIAQSFALPSIFHLNRPLVTVLEARGVPRDVFMGLQASALEDVQRITNSLRSAARLLPMHQLGVALDLPSILLNLYRLLQVDEIDVLSRDSGMLGPFLRDTMHLCLLHIKRALKHKARIPVPNAHLVVGVPDETGSLKEGEVYCAIRNRYESEFRNYTGPVLIVRSPTVHMAMAVERTEPFFQARQNVLVFSTQGKRPLCNMLAGGDLDGDEYAVVALEALHPKPSPAALYGAVQDHSLHRKCDFNDVIDGVVRFFARDVLGLIGDRHLLVADQSQKGPYEQRCMELAELYSQAVDSAKTGTFPALEAIPGRLLKVMPDFMQPPIPRSSGRPADIYQSARALGHLYRQVGELPVKDFDDIFTEDDQLIDPDSCVTEALKNALYSRGFDTEVDHGLLDDARAWLRDFGSALRHIAFDNVDGKGVGELAECEVVAGSIAAPPVHQRHRKALLERLEAQVKMLVSSAKMLIAPSNAGPKRKAAGAWAAWHAANEIPVSPPFGARTYALLTLDMLFVVIQESPRVN